MGAGCVRDWHSGDAPRDPPVPPLPKGGKCAVHPLSAIGRRVRQAKPARGGPAVPIGRPGRFSDKKPRHPGTIGPPGSIVSPPLNACTRLALVLLFGVVLTAFPRAARAQPPDL